MINKSILYGEKVAEIVISELVGLFAVSEYTIDDSAVEEHNNDQVSNVLYVSKVKVLPPILVEIQDTVDTPSFASLANYSRSVKERYRTLPIVISIAIQDVTDNDLLKKISESNITPYFKKLPSFGWARKCYLMSFDSIYNYTNGERNINPLVAFGFCLMQQKHPSSDTTIVKTTNRKTLRLLYDIDYYVSDHFHYAGKELIKEIESVARAKEKTASENVKDAQSDIRKVTKKTKKAPIRGLVNLK